MGLLFGLPCIYVTGPAFARPAGAAATALKRAAPSWTSYSACEVIFITGFSNRFCCLLTVLT